MANFRISGGKFLNDDGSVVASGTLTLTLVNPAPSFTPIIIATGAIAPTSYSFALDANGVLTAPQTVVGNNEIYPAGTYWQASVNSSGKSIALVNTDFAVAAGAAATVATPGIANVAGNCLIAFISWITGGGTAVTSVTDSAGNTYVQVPNALSSAGSSGSIDVWVAQNCKVAASNVVTATFNTSVVQRGIAVHQYQGIATSSAVGGTTNGQANNTGAGNPSNAPATSAGLVTSRASGVLVGGVEAGTTWTTTTPGSGYTLQVNQGAGGLATQDQIVTVLGSYADGFTLGTSVRWCTVLVFLKGEPSWGPANWIIGPPVPNFGSLFPNLTVLPNSSISSSMLPSNVAFTDVVQTFTAAQTFNSPVVVNASLLVGSSTNPTGGTDAAAMRSATTGRLWLGSDGNVYIDRNSASSVQIQPGSGGTGNITGTLAGSANLGSGAIPWASLYIGAAATNNIQLIGTATAARVVTLPDNTGTIAELNLTQTFSGAWTINPASAVGLKIAPTTGAAFALIMKDKGGNQRFTLQPSVTFNTVFFDTDGATGLLEASAGQSLIWIAGTQGGTTHTECRGASPQTGDLFLARTPGGADSLFGITGTGKLDIGAPGGGTSTMAGLPHATFYASTQQVTIRNTTIPTSVLVGANNIQPNWMIAGRSIRIRGKGVISTAPASFSGVMLRALISGLIVSTSLGVNGPSTSLVNAPIFFDIHHVCRTPGASGGVYSTGIFGWVNGTGQPNEDALTNVTQTIDFTSTNSFDVQFAWTGAAPDIRNSVTWENVTIEFQ